MSGRQRFLALACGALLAVPTVAKAACDDEALSIAAAVLLEAGRAIDGDGLRAALVAARSSDVRVRAAVLDAEDASGVAAFLERARARADAPLVCGEARSAARRVVLATGRGGRIDLGEQGLRVELAEGFDEPELVVEGPDGRAERSLLALDGARGASLGHPGPDVARVQLLARGPDGVRPVAEWAVALEAPVDVTLAAGASPGETVAALRAASERSSLRSNRLLARVAGAHAARVCRAGRAAHAPEGGDDPAERLRRAGLEARHVGEAVGVGESLREALEALARSPAHRAALLDPRMTDLGTAVAEAQGRRCVVVLLAAWPRAVAGR